MIGFGCGTIRLNKYGCNDGRPPVMKLVGDQLIKKDTKYKRMEDKVTNLQDGIKIGTTSKHSIGKSKLLKLGVHPVYEIGVIPSIDIYRPNITLGKVKPSIFGKKEFGEIGVVNINSQPPSAIIVPSSKSQLKISENYWNLVAENIKKISSAVKKYFKDI